MMPRLIVLSLCFCSCLLLGFAFLLSFAFLFFALRRSAFPARPCDLPDPATDPTLRRTRPCDPSPVRPFRQTSPTDRPFATFCCFVALFVPSNCIIVEFPEQKAPLF